MPERENRERGTMKIFSHSKRGNILLESIFILVFLLLFVFMVVVGGKLFLSMAETTHDGNTFTNSTQTILENTQSRYYTIFDNIFLMLFIGINILPVILAYFVKSSPFFVVFAILGLIVIGLFAIYFSDIYLTMTSQDGFTDINTLMPKTDKVMTYLPIFTVVLTVVLIVVQYSKPEAVG